MSSYYNQGVQVIVGNGQNFPGTPRISLIPFIQNAYDKGLLNFTVLPPGSISLAEIQDISTAKILGRSTAGSGVIEQISIGTGLSLSGGTLSSTATATPGGSDTQIQYNNAGSFAGSANLVTTTSNMLDIQGSGSTSATNALRVRNSAGTNLLTVRNDGSTAIGSTPNGDPLYINESVAAGNKVFLRLTSAGTDIIKLGAHINSGHGLISTTYRLNIDGGTDGVNVLGKLNVGSNILPSAGFTVSTDTTASTPSMLLSGTGFSGGTSTTTKPTFLIEPTGTVSTTWNTNGTKFGINSENGFTGNLLDLKSNNATKFSIDSDGKLIISSYIKGPYTNILLGEDTGAAYFMYQTTKDVHFMSGSSTKFLHRSSGNVYFNGSGGSTIFGTDGIDLSGINTKLQVSGSIYASNMVGIGMNPSGGLGVLQAKGSGTTNGILAYFTNSTPASVLVIDDSGRITAGNGTQATTNQAIRLNSTAQGLMFNNLTTTQRNAVSWVSGDAGTVIFNTTLVKLQVWNGTAWETITSV